MEVAHYALQPRQQLPFRGIKPFAAEEIVLERLQNQLFGSVDISRRERECLDLQGIMVAIEKVDCLLLDVAVDILDYAHSYTHYHFMGQKCEKNRGSLSRPPPQR